MTTNATTGINYSNCTEHRQGWDLDEQLTITGRGRRDLETGNRPTHEVRIRIHHDTYYPLQSTARAEVWSPADLRWNEIATYSAGEWAYDADTNETGAGTDGLWLAREELRARAQHLLGIAR